MNMDYRTQDALDKLSLAISDIRMEILDVKRELSDINTRLDTIISQMSANVIAVGNMNDTLVDLKTSSEKVDAHIDFVDGVYDMVRKPLSTILGRQLTHQNNDMPTIE